MFLNDLKKSVSELPLEELLILLSKMRASRRTSKEPPRKKDKSGEVLESLDSMVGKLSAAERKKLLDLMKED